MAGGGSGRTSQPTVGVRYYKRKTRNRFAIFRLRASLRFSTMSQDVRLFRIVLQYTEALHINSL